MASEKVRGTVVAYDDASNGVFINQKWFYPVGKSSEYVNESLQGFKVELSLQGEGPEFSFIKKLPESEQGEKLAQSGRNQGSEGKQGYWEKRESREVEKDERVSRHGALNTAVAILGSVEDDSSKGLSKYLLKACTVADQVLKYVGKDENLKQKLRDTLKSSPEPTKSSYDRDGFDDSVVPIEDLEDG